MIEITNLSKSFQEKILFKNFNLNIENGEFVIFSGESGCGKTTLLNMIGSIEKIDSGKITVDGIDISQKKNQLNYYKTKIGFLFQNFALVENKTVKENLTLVKKSALSGISIHESLEQVGLLDKLNQKVYKLSGGEQQRVALARLMIKKCDIILADEPTGSLDKKNALHVMSIINSLNKNGKTIILVTHDDEIKTHGNRIIEIPKI